MMQLFFFNDTATTEIYTLSLHDALPICGYVYSSHFLSDEAAAAELLEKNPQIDMGTLRTLRFQQGRYARSWVGNVVGVGDRKSTRLNSSHANISYAVFCLKKNKINITTP